MAVDLSALLRSVVEPCCRTAGQSNPCRSRSRRLRSEFSAMWSRLAPLLAAGAGGAIRRTLNRRCHCQDKLESIMLRHHQLEATMLGAGTPLAEVCIAVVHASDTVPFVAAGRNRTDVMPRLADWVVEQAPLHLWDEDAQSVSVLVSRGDVEGAVQIYFHSLGAPGARIRWERQWLVIQTVSVSGEVAAPA